MEKQPPSTSLRAYLHTMERPAGQSPMKVLTFQSGNPWQHWTEEEMKGFAYRRDVLISEALIRELLAALVKVRYGPVTIEEYEAVLANAKAAGVEP